LRAFGSALLISAGVGKPTIFRSMLLLLVDLNPLSGLLGFALGLNHPFWAQRVSDFTT
jgi:hypothetical protein